MKRNIKVAIPLKTNSQRVENKNLRPFFEDKSLFDIKAQQLLRVFNGDDVYVSSENPIVESLCQKYGFNFHLRDEELTKATAKETHIVKAITAPMPKDCDVMWVQVTQPLFNEFEKIIEIWENVCETNDSLAVVKKLRHHIINFNGQGINFNFGYWHKISQDINQLYEVTWSAFIMSRELVDEAYYQIGRTPYLYEAEFPLWDIDTVEDFEIAKIIYEKYRK